MNHSEPLISRYYHGYPQVSPPLRPCEGSVHPGDSGPNHGADAGEKKLVASFS